MFDVIIIGSGFAGAQAAMTLVARGLKVAVISTNSSVTRYFSGAFDVLDDPSFSAPSFARSHSDSLASALTSLLARDPHHLYSMLGNLAGSKNIPKQVTSLAGEFFDHHGWQTTGDGQNYVYGIAPSGILKPTAYVLADQRTDDLFGRKVLIVGFDKLPDYSATRIATGLAPYIKGRAVTLGDTVAFPKSFPADVSQSLKTPKGWEALATALEGLLRDEDAIVLPPVFDGLEDLRNLEKRLQLPVRQTLSLVPSVTGERLTQAIEGKIAATTTFVREAVTGFEAREGAIVAVHTPSQVLEGRQIILATGKFLGGGITPEGREAVFGLTVTYNGKALPPKSGNDAIAAPQEVFMAGISVDRTLRPLDANGQVTYVNLHAAGRILAGSDPAIERSSFGLSLLSGHLAALQAASLL